MPQHNNFGMVAKAPTPANKRRVRTGCLTCRKRRRKCDERKPKCENCESKGLSCRYGGLVTFVERSNPAASEVEAAATQRNTPGYARLTFLDGHPKASTKPAKRARVEAATAESVGLGGVVSQVVDADHGPPSGINQNEDDSLSAELYQAPPIQRRVTGSPRESVSNSNVSTEDFGKHMKSQGEQEFELLRQYRYQIAPWIDIGDPKSSFGIELLLKAKSSKPLLKAILRLTNLRNSACRLAIAQHLVEPSFSSLRAAEDVSEVASGTLQRAVDVLSMLQDVVTSEPQQWRPLMISHNPKYDSAQLNRFHSSVDNAIFWVYFKFDKDLAASLVASQAPLMSNLSTTQQRNSPSIPGIKESNLSETAFHNVLLLLARSLTVLFGDRLPIQSSGYSDAASFASTRSPPLSTRWTTLWSENQKWYAERPAELRQVYEMRSAEVSQTDMANQASFPVIVFTTSLALLANAVHHITSLLLLTHKPRLVKSTTGSRITRSSIWHAQYIAGIAESNDSPDQWDALLVAGLFLAARSMSHEAQQTIILDTLHQIKQFTGMKLDDELHTMRSDWQMSRDG